MYFIKCKKIIALCLCVLLVSCDQTLQTTNPATDSSFLYKAKGSGIAGNARGDITIVEFFDYRCEACKLSFPALYTLPLIDPGARIVYRELPMLGPVAVIAAKAALAARYQHRYLIFHHALMSAPSLNTPEQVFDVAKQVGLDVALLQDDMNRSEVRERIDENMALAKALHITGTPVFILAKTEWQGDNMLVSNSILYPGALTLTTLKKMMVELRLNTV